MFKAEWLCNVMNDMIVTGTAPFHPTFRMVIEMPRILFGNNKVDCFCFIL